MARDLWLTLLAQAGRQGPLAVKRRLLEECAPEQVEQAKELGVLGDPGLAPCAVDPRYDDGPLEVEFTDDGPMLHTPADAPEAVVPTRRAELERYPVSVEALLAGLARANNLTGKPRRLHCGLWLLGRRKSAARSVAVCLLPASLRGPTRQLLQEAHDELSRSPMTVLLPQEHTLDAAAVSELRGREILTLALEDRLGPDLHLDLEEVRAIDGRRGTDEPILKVDVPKGAAWFGGVPLALRKAAFSVLNCLAARPGEWVSPERACEAVGEDPALPDKWMADRVSEVRAALADAAEQSRLSCLTPRELLVNKRGFGYSLQLPPEQIERNL